MFYFNLSFGQNTTDEYVQIPGFKISSSEDIRGWSWDGETASYLAESNGKTILYIRGFDGYKFDENYEEIIIGRSGDTRGWNWSEGKASYCMYIYPQRTTSLIFRQFDGKKFGVVTKYSSIKNINYKKPEPKPKPKVAISKNNHPTVRTYYSKNCVYTVYKTSRSFYRCEHLEYVGVIGPGYNPVTIKGESVTIEIRHGYKKRCEGVYRLNTTIPARGGGCVEEEIFDWSHNCE